MYSNIRHIDYSSTNDLNGTIGREETLSVDISLLFRSYKLVLVAVLIFERSGFIM